MIDYEITVNVGGLSHAEKKRVQDAFFKLGIPWPSSLPYAYLNEDTYSNTSDLGVVHHHLMWARSGRVATHTFNQLMELAGTGEGPTPHSPVTITVSHSELLRMYFVMGRVNGHCIPVPGEKSLWRKLNDIVKANYDFAAIEKLRKEFPLGLIDYQPYQVRAEALMHSAKNKRQRTEIQELKDRIAKLEAEL